MESVLWGEFEINGNEILESQGQEKVKSIGKTSGSDINARLNQVKVWHKNANLKPNIQ